MEENKILENFITNYITNYITGNVESNKIGNGKTKEAIGLTNKCTDPNSKGRTMEVYICDDVYKSCNYLLSDKTKIENKTCKEGKEGKEGKEAVDGKKLIKVNKEIAFTLTQIIMKNISKNYKDLAFNIEHPTDIGIYMEEGKKRIIMKFDKQTMTLQDFLIKTTTEKITTQYNEDNNEDNSEVYVKDDNIDFMYTYTKDKYIEELIKILNKIFEVNQKLFDIFQFQHCDMKCAQILLGIDVLENPPNITPIISDFDTSTCTININNELFRVILKTDESYFQGTNKKSRIQAGIARWIQSQYVREMSKKGEQFNSRYKSYVYENNDFYNACLLASVLLLINKDLYDKFKTVVEGVTEEGKEGKEKILKINEYIKYINFIKINENRGSDKEKTGNQIAADCVKEDKIKENRSCEFESKITIKKNGTIEIVEQPQTPSGGGFKSISRKRRKKKTKKKINYRSLKKIRRKRRHTNKKKFKLILSSKIL